MHLPCAQISSPGRELSSGFVYSAHRPFHPRRFCCVLHYEWVGIAWLLGSSAWWWAGCTVAVAHFVNRRIVRRHVLLREAK